MLASPKAGQRELLAVLDQVRIAGIGLKLALLAGPSTIRIIDGSASKPPKCYVDSDQDVGDWFPDPLSQAEHEAFQAFTPHESKHGKPGHKALDCSIMDAVDDFAYGVHDLEDAIALDLVTRERFAAAVQDRCPSFPDALRAKYPVEGENDVLAQMVDGLFGGAASRKLKTSELVLRLLSHVPALYPYLGR